MSKEEPVRMLIAIEVAQDEAQDLCDALGVFFNTKAPRVKFNIRLVQLEVDDGPED